MFCTSIRVHQHMLLGVLNRHGVHRQCQLNEEKLWNEEKWVSRYICLLDKASLVGVHNTHLKISLFHTSTSFRNFKISQWMKRQCLNAWNVLTSQCDLYSVFIVRLAYFHCNWHCHWQQHLLKWIKMTKRAVTMKNSKSDPLNDSNTRTGTHTLWFVCVSLAPKRHRKKKRSKNKWNHKASTAFSGCCCFFPSHK